MTDTVLSPLEIARANVTTAFAGYIGNEDAVYAMQRAIALALADAGEGQPVAMARTFLLSGAPSTGKTELARRAMKVLGLPFVRLDGRAVKTRDHLFEMVDDALLAQKPPLYAEADGKESGMPKLIYPAFAVFIDEIHLVSERTQEAFLTLLESDERTMLLNGERGRRIAVVKQASWIFATTKPADLDRAFRSRCTEIQLRKYSVEEVQLMVSKRFSMLPDKHLETIAACSRCTPRIAFDLARDVIDEIKFSTDGDIPTAIKRVMHGRGIYFYNGVTLDDLRYLLVLQREKRAMGEGALKAQLYDVDPLRVTDDIETFLIGLGFIIVTSKGRQLTAAGERFLADARKSDKLPALITRLVRS
jgi:Holliday junction resolvasome RuvABC ATP-dependent DNA helicase subunit